MLHEIPRVLLNSMLSLQRLVCSANLWIPRPFTFSLLFAITEKCTPYFPAFGNYTPHPLPQHVTPLPLAIIIENFRIHDTVVLSLFIYQVGLRAGAGTGIDGKGKSTEGGGKGGSHVSRYRRNR